jgi:predicted outer membrane protein
MFAGSSGKLVGLGIALLALTPWACGGSETTTDAAARDAARVDGGGSGGTGGSAASGGSGGSAASGGSGGSVSGGSGGSAASGGSGGSSLDGAVVTRDGGTDAPVDGPADARPADAATDGPIRLLDPQVLGVMLEANSGEIAAGQVAVTRASMGEVKSFGMRMVDEHGSANEHLAMVIAHMSIIPEDSPVRQMLHAQAGSTVDMLWATPAGTFDREYMTSQVAMHTMVLQLIDTVLMPSASANLRADVIAMRDTVVAHLEAARGILAALTADGGAADGGVTDAGPDGAGADADGP